MDGTHAWTRPGRLTMRQLIALDALAGAGHSKLDARDRAQLVIAAYESGLVRPGTPV